ncbi:MAG: acetyl-CoA carboxylase, carboxyltransferase subunit beta [Myxococcota bacterium]
MSWFKRMASPKVTGEDKTSVPTGLWKRCPACGSAHLADDVASNLGICPSCEHHYRIGGRERLNAFLDEGSIEELAGGLEAVDALGFRDSQRYVDRVKKAGKATGLGEAFTLVTGRLKGRPAVAGAFEFKFLGGSMGSVVGEKITRAFEVGIEDRRPVVLFSASGGARMQEGILSLMQMAKTSAAIGRFRETGQPFVSVLTDPTTGGVAASFALLGDVIVAEPKALIGFAGPRVIEQTIRQKLPEGFQRSEFLLEHGMVDMIVHRHQMRDRVASLFELLGGPA